MSRFFKSVWFRCITVLTVIAVVLSGTLAILNQVLYVSPAERTMRSIKKIYGKEVEFETLLDSESGWVYEDEEGNELAVVTKVYKVGEKTDEYDLLFKSEGGRGYKNGSITLWIKVVYAADTDCYDVDKVVLEGYEKQTLMSKLGGEFYDGFKLKDVTEAYQNGELFTTKADGVNANPISGATMSANAGCNAVNAVIKCVAEKGWEKE